MIKKTLDRITAEDIIALIDNQEHEGKTLEYKVQLYPLPKGRDDDAVRKRLEACRDISAFANSEGGDIVFGISDSIDLVGIDPDTDLDRYMLSLSNALDGCVTPKIGGLRHKVIDCGEGKRAMVLRIPKSVSAPHMVSHPQLAATTESFWLRNPNGKRRFDVAELRDAFGQATTFADRIRTERYNRLSLLAEGSLPVELKNPAMVVLHIFPLNAFSGNGLHVSSQQIAGLRKVVQPFHAGELGSVGWTLNLAGVLTFQKDQGETVQGYTQVFRSGGIEAVDNVFFSEGKGKFVNPGYEGHVISAAREYLDLLTSMDVNPPFVLMLTILNVEGYHLPLNFGRIAGHEIDERFLILPDVEVDVWPTDLAQTFRPVFDMVWQAMGIVSSPNYDKAGNWVEPKR